MVTLFLGYEKRDESIARELIPILKALGIDVWEYQSSIAPGNGFTKQIEEKISSQADAAAFIITQNTLESDFIIEFEIPFSIDRKKRDRNFSLFFILFQEDYSILKQVHSEISYLQAIQMTQLEFEEILAKGGDLLSKILENRGDITKKEITIRAYDRETTTALEGAILNCNWSDILGTGEVLTENWLRLQKIIRKIKDVLIKFTGLQVINLEGRLRYTSSFILGYEFRQPTGYKFIIPYNEDIWETPKELIMKNEHLNILEPSISEPSKQLILDISLSHPNIRAIEKYLKIYPNQLLRRNETKVTIEPLEGPSRSSVDTGKTAENISLQIYEKMLTFYRKYSCKNVHMFFNGPFPIALFLGWLWNKGPEVHLYEFDGRTQTYFKEPYKVQL